MNNYKYVVVPIKFDFFNEKDKYQLNSLTKFLFNKYGFHALLEGEDYPDEMMNNRCLVLKSNVLRESSMFKTKLKVVLKDCNDNIVYSSPFGDSREKEYKDAYNEAIRKAFGFIKQLNYEYKPTEKVIVSNSSVVKEQDKTTEYEEVKKLKAEIENLKKKRLKEKSLESKPKIPVQVQISSSNLYAQPIENGFQLVDSSPKVVYKIKNTGLENVFLVEGKSAIIYKKDYKWVIEYYTSNKLKTEVLNIKF
ncbi:hypothetical protein N1F78_03520 [Seonamhaeicola sp. MEBiC1930]|uniref:hypothetical protein n=1 Tax=Seonamhaeicola sp. MEBiC01930 TaxID=2976768 RepID=UPI003254364C